MLSVSADLDLVLVLGGDRVVVVPTTLQYSSENPYAVTALFRTTEGDVGWIFGRDLLAEGLAGPAGEGDVTVWPSADGKVVCVALDSPSGGALLEADLEHVRGFLADTYRLVPEGAESGLMDLDSEIAALLDAPAALTNAAGSPCEDGAMSSLRILEVDSPDPRPRRRRTAPSCSTWWCDLASARTARDSLELLDELRERFGDAPRGAAAALPR
jgi:hypothetical protein